MKIVKKVFKILGVLFFLYLTQDLLFSLHSDVMHIRYAHFYSDPDAWKIKEQTLAYKLFPIWTNYMTDKYEDFNKCSAKYQGNYFAKGSPGAEESERETEAHRAKNCPNYKEIKH